MTATARAPSNAGQRWRAIGQTLAGSAPARQKALNVGRTDRWERLCRSTQFVPLTQIGTPAPPRRALDLLGKPLGSVLEDVWEMEAAVSALDAVARSSRAKRPTAPDELTRSTGDGNRCGVPLRIRAGVDATVQLASVGGVRRPPPIARGAIARGGIRPPSEPGPSTLASTPVHHRSRTAEPALPALPLLPRAAGLPPSRRRPRNHRSRRNRRKPRCRRPPPSAGGGLVSALASTPVPPPPALHRCPRGRPRHRSVPVPPEPSPPTPANRRVPDTVTAGAVDAAAAGRILPCRRI